MVLAAFAGLLGRLKLLPFLEDHACGYENVQRVVDTPAHILLILFLVGAFLDELLGHLPVVGGWVAFEDLLDANAQLPQAFFLFLALEAEATFLVDAVEAVLKRSRMVNLEAGARGLRELTSLSVISHY